MIRTTLGFAASFLLAGTALAAPVTDCPNRDAPFSADSPLMDILLSPAAAAIVDEGRATKLPNAPTGFLSTKAPSFAAILSLKEAGRFTGMKPEEVAPIDAKLRALPVTEADKVARCERYDNDVPNFTLAKGKKHVLVFEKINGFKDVPSVNAAHAALIASAARKGWDLHFTQSGGAFNASTLAQFDTVIWNNISGDVLTLSQRDAFKNWMERGGAFVGMHGSAGDPVYFWDWYPDTLVGARFLGHPMAPQFQDARVVVEGRKHAAAKGLPKEWTMTEEWYSFKNNPRATGSKVIATLDETTYKPDGMGINLRMGDHPIAWTRCVGNGRMFYSAIGHRPESYSQPQAAMLLENGITWAITAKRACPAR